MICFVFFPLIREGREMLPFVAGLTGAKSSSHNGHRPGYTLDELPAHRRTLTDGICNFWAQGYFDM